MNRRAEWRPEDEITYTLRPEAVPSVFAAFHPPGGVLALDDWSFVFSAPRRTDRVYFYLADDGVDVERIVLDLNRAHAVRSQKQRSPGVSNERSQKLADVDLDALGAPAVTVSFLKLKLRTNYESITGDEALDVDFDLVVPIDDEWRLVAETAFHQLEIESHHAALRTGDLESGRFLAGLAPYFEPARSKPDLVRAALGTRRPYARLPDRQGLVRLQEAYRQGLVERAGDPPFSEFAALARC